MIRGSYCHRTGYYKVFCIELIPKRCLYSLGGVPPSREHLEKTVLQRHSLRSACIHIVSQDIFFRSGQRCPVNPRKLSVKSDGNSNSGCTQGLIDWKRPYEDHSTSLLFFLETQTSSPKTRVLKHCEGCRGHRKTRARLSGFPVQLQQQC